MKKIKDIKVWDIIYYSNYWNIQWEFYFNITSKIINKITPKKLFYTEKQYSLWWNKSYIKTDRQLFKKHFEEVQWFDNYKELFETIKDFMDKVDKNDDNSNNIKKAFRKAYIELIENKDTIFNNINNL